MLSVALRTQRESCEHRKLRTLKAALMGRSNVVVSLVSGLLGGGCLGTPTIAVKM